jgi:xylulokinase
MSLLGIDIGTSGCKAGAFSADGRCLANAYREYPTLHPQPGWAELDSRQVWQCVREVIAEAAAGTAGDPITALCVSSMGEAMVPVTRDRKILGASILSSDPRGAEYIQALKTQISQNDFYAINPNILGPNYSLPKLAWLREHDPDLFRQADLFLLWGDLVGFMLGTDPATSPSLANRTLLLDIRREDWSEKLLGLSGIAPEKLPRILPSGAVCGQVAPGQAQELGLPKNVQVVVGGHDQGCNALGAGIIQAGRAVCGLGSFECITPVFDRLPEGAAMLGHGLNTEHHVLPGLYVAFLYNQAGTLIKWFRNTFAAADRKLAGADADLYALLSREMPPAPSRLLTLPYFELTGPPDFTADAAGVIAWKRCGAWASAPPNSSPPAAAPARTSGCRSRRTSSGRRSRARASPKGACWAPPCWPAWPPAFSERRRKAWRASCASSASSSPTPGGTSSTANATRSTAGYSRTCILC